MTTPPFVMSFTHFVKQTTPKAFFKRGRSSLVDVDQGLDGWAKSDIWTVEERCKHLIKLLKAIRLWEEKKSKKNSTTANDRKTTVRELGNQIFARLQYEEFERRKVGGKTQNLKSLSAGYGHERQVYLDTGKSFAPSGKAVHTVLEGRKAFGLDTNKRFDQLTKQEFDSIAQQYGPLLMEGTGEVYFMKKADRVKRLLFIDDGAFWEASEDGRPVKVETSAYKGEFMYAMDEYGNLFGQDSQIALDSQVEKRTKQQLRQFNHSSFNAGKDVICAGTLVIRNGYLREVTNFSGHYKPTAQNVVNLLRVFREARVDLAANVKVTILDTNQMATYNVALLFMDDPNRRPDHVKQL